MPTPSPLPVSDELRDALAGAPRSLATSIRATFASTCPACRARIEWAGRMVDRPACRCGHRRDEASRERDQLEYDGIIERLRTDL